MVLPSLYIAEFISKLYASANPFLAKNSSTFSFLVEARRIELRSILNWWRRGESNSGPY